MTIWSYLCSDNSSKAVGPCLKFLNDSTYCSLVTGWLLSCQIHVHPSSDPNACSCGLGYAIIKCVGRGEGRVGVGRVAGRGLMHKDFYLLILGSGKMEEVAFSCTTHFSPAGGLAHLCFLLEPWSVNHMKTAQGNPVQSLPWEGPSKFSQLWKGEVWGLRLILKSPFTSA